MKKLSKRMAALSTKIEDRIYAPLEALSIIKENANAKFDETIEAHIRLGIDPKYTDQQLRTTVALPHGTGQSIKIAVIKSINIFVLYSNSEAKDVCKNFL